MPEKQKRTVDFFPPLMLIGKFLSGSLSVRTAVRLISIGLSFRNPDW